MSHSRTVLSGRYEIERELGRGGMSIVYSARDLQLLSRRVVVKVLLEQMSAEEWGRKKFLQEMEALSRIDHPGVVGVLDSGRTDAGAQYLVMQYVEGVTLRRVLEAPMPVSRVAGIVRQIGNALGAAHEKGVCHRDLKPENVMLQNLPGGGERVILIDFGIAGVKDSTFKGDKTMIAGSSAYMAPEQFDGRPSAASDIYALGVVAYEMLTGCKPFDSGTFAHLVSPDAARAAAPSDLVAAIPPAAERAIQRAMSFRPEDRQASVTEFSEELFVALTSGGSGPRKQGEGALELAHVLFIDATGGAAPAAGPARENLALLQRHVRESGRYRLAASNGDVTLLPAEDGLALAFFGDPSAPAQCALEVAATLKGRAEVQPRMGINSGPVFRAADLNANANVTGGGIQVARQVMEFGDPGHILISQGAADVLFQLSGWAPCLFDLGEHPAKPGVKTHLYNLATAEVGNPAWPSRLAGRRQPGGIRVPKALIAALVLLVVAGGAWALWRIWKGAPSEPLELSYFITVQRYRGGERYGEPFRLPGEIVFERDYRIKIPVSSSQSGYLYVANLGSAAQHGKPSLVLLEPRAGELARREAGFAEVLPSATASFRFDTAVGRETLFLVWAREPVPELERMRQFPNQETLDAGEMRPALEFLEENRRDVKVNKDESTRETKLQSTGKVLVHAISLEHL